MVYLTETADHDEPGSWGRASEGWPEVHGSRAYDMYVFANCVDTIPYGSYVLMREAGKYGAKETYLRVHPDHFDKLRTDFVAAAEPAPIESMRMRDEKGELRDNGLRGRAPRWWW